MVVQQSKNALIEKKYLIAAEITNATPLLIGSGEADGQKDMLILKDGNGYPLIPGTSLAGVLRSKIKAIYNENVENLIFGNIKEKKNEQNQSMLNIRDIVLKDENGKPAVVICRDCVRLDPFASSAENKFDFEAVERGATGKFFIELTVRAKLAERAERISEEISFVHTEYETKKDLFGDVVATIADMLTSGIQVGAKTASGLGKIQSCIPAGVVEFDFRNSKDTLKWLFYLQDKTKLPQNIYISPKNVGQVLPKGDLCVSVLASINSALLIKNYDNIEKDDNNNDDDKAKISAVQLKSKDAYLIPGTSLRGVIRHEAYKILQSIYKDDENKVQDFIFELMGNVSTKGNADEKLEAAKASKLSVEEIYISKEDVNSSVKQKRIRINRFTRSVMPSSLFTEQPIWQTNGSLTPIHLNIYVKECSEKMAGLVLLIMRNIFQGRLSIGSGKGIGRGFITGRYAEMIYNNGTNDSKFIFDATNGFEVTGNKAVLDSYVKRLAGE